MADHKCRPLPVLTREQIDKFWSNVRMGSIDACWPWEGPAAGYGYGLYISGSYRMLSHRVALVLSSGQDSPLHTLHSCDNPPCCNPIHLSWGTHADNMREMADRGRASRLPKNRSLATTRRFISTVRRWLVIIGFGYCSGCHLAVPLTSLVQGSNHSQKCKRCEAKRVADYQKRAKAARVVSRAALGT